MTLWFWQKGVLNWEVRWNYAASRAPYGPSVRGTIRVHQMHYLLSKSWLGAFSFHLTTCPPFPLCHKDSFLSFCCTGAGKLSHCQSEWSWGRHWDIWGPSACPRASIPQLSPRLRDRSSVPLGEGLRESLVQNSKVSKKCSFFKEAWGCTKKGDAWPINIWAGFLGSPGSLELFAMQSRAFHTWFTFGRKYFASDWEHVFGRQKNILVKT